MSPNLDLNPLRLMPLEIFDYTFQTALQVKEFICTCEQYVVNYTHIHVPQYQPYYPEIYFIVLKSWHIQHEKVSFCLSQVINSFDCIFFFHVKVNVFS